MDLNEFKKDAQKEQDGIWIDGPEGSRFRIRSADSKQYRNALAALARKYSPGRLRKDGETQLKMVIEAMAEALVLDWDGIEDNGQPLPCTKENAMRILSITELRELVASEAQDIANFRSEALAADAEDLKSDG